MVGRGISARSLAGGERVRVQASIVSSCRSSSADQSRPRRSGDSNPWNAESEGGSQGLRELPLTAGLAQSDGLFLTFELQFRDSPAQLGRESLESLDIRGSHGVFVTLHNTGPESFRSSVYASGNFCELLISRHRITSVKDLCGADRSPTGGSIPDTGRHSIVTVVAN